MRQSHHVFRWISLPSLVAVWIIERMVKKLEIMIDIRGKWCVMLIVVFRWNFVTFEIENVLLWISGIERSTSKSSWIIKFYGDFFFFPFSLPSWFNCRIDGVSSSSSMFSVRSVKNSQKRNAKYQSNYQNRQSLFPCFIKWITRHSWNLRCVIQREMRRERLFGLFLFEAHRMNY